MLHHPIILTLGTVLHFTAFGLVTFHSLQRRRNASSTLLWIFIAWSFPLVGPLFYLTFGVDRVADRGFKKFLTEEHLLSTRAGTREAAPFAYWHDIAEAPAGNELQQGMDHVLNALLPDHPAHAGNRLTPLAGGDEAYPAMLTAIRGAQKHIHLQSFIIGRDTISHEFMDALAAKAAEGVQVRVLYDRFGSTRAHRLGFFLKYRWVKNIQIAGWTQANPLKRQLQINLRNHRKALIVDGKTAFFGGVNLHDENTSAHKNGPIRDYHFAAEGPIVQELQYSFLRDWYFITGENPETLLTENYFPKSGDAGDVTVRLINSGPSTEKDVAIETFFNAVTLAKKEVLAVTPYFVPPAEILRALHSAALRGVDVRLIVPQKNNHRYAGFASRALYEDLLLAGVKIYERHPPFMHAKALVVDGELALIGTANLDNRSLSLNYETSAAVYSKPFADALKNLIHEDIDSSDEILLVDWHNRPVHRRFLENLAALMSPVL
ncbi:MAG: cardiolipin synthase [Kiritimatiellaeota bacterium]|nr:cardiolipin synthase [Kiritimatiellota bacterium]